LELANAPKELKKMVADGQISASLAQETLNTTKDSDVATELIKEAVKAKGGKVSKKDIQEDVQSFSQVKERKQRPVGSFTAGQVQEMMFLQLVRAVESVRNRGLITKEIEKAILDTNLVKEKPD
jgi:outer membrane lipopolysaccharide assembly protein LptE/RlpB